MANKYGKNAKLLLFFIAETTRKQPHINRLLDIMHGLTTIYNVRLVNKTNIYSAFVQKPREKLLVILFNEDGLGNQEFRECVRTLLAARVSIIGILDEGMSKDRALSFFCLNNKRKQMLEDIVTNAICFEKDTLFRATQLVDRIQALCRPISSRLVDRLSPSRLPRIVEMESVNLEACLKLKKVVLRPMIRSQNQQRPRILTCAFNSNNSQQKTQFSSFVTNKVFQESTKCLPKTSKQSSVSSPSSVSSGKINHTQKLKHTTQKSPKQIRCYFPSAILSNSLPAPSSPKNTDRQSSKKAIKLTCPTIEISHEVDEDVNDFPDKITESHKRLPWTITTNKKHSVNNNSNNNNDNDDKDKNKNADELTSLKTTTNERLSARRFSFDYISKTYAVFDPERNKTLHINFPYGVDVLKRDSFSDIINSALASRRNSFFISNSVSSSIDDINLESLADSVNIFDSPIPSPILRRQNFIYQDPLPAFPDEICFPPLERFPCETFQKRRPSVLDVLLT